MDYRLNAAACALLLTLSAAAQADGGDEAALRSSAIEGASEALGRCTASALAITSTKAKKPYTEQPPRADKAAYGLYVKSLHECLKTVQDALEPPLKALEQDLKVYAG